MCDDENVEPIDEADIFRYFGDYPSGAGYVMFYQAADLDLGALGLKSPAPPPAHNPVPAAAKPIVTKPEPLIEVDEPEPQRVAPISPPPPIPVVQRTPDQLSSRSQTESPAVQRTPSQSKQTVQRTPSQSKDDNKWYQRKKEEDQPRIVSSGSYSGGGGLGRKLSGISGKGLMSRSGSLMKLGLGKKDKQIEE